MTDAPKRIQLRRTKGWRKPEGAVVVARPTHWGNPYRVDMGLTTWLVWNDRTGGVVSKGHPSKADAAARAVALYREHFDRYPGERTYVRRQLAGHDLACWCPLDQPCHADVLLELANAPPSRTPGDEA